MIWRDITLQNREELIGQMDAWIDEMQRVKKILMENDDASIEEYFKTAKDVRDALPISTGAFYTTYDLYVDIPDYHGVISEITGYLAEEKISITNIRVVETREDVFGILVISFQNEKDREKAMNCIRSHTNFEMHVS